jgi:GAF domain-containing protein
MERPHTETAATPDDLAAALGELANLMIDTTSLADLLDDACRLATTVLSPPASCGITLNQGPMAHTVASSDQRASLMDEVQYQEGEGPCLETMRTGNITLVSDLATEERWSSYTSHVLGYGVRSSLSLPLIVNGHARGALNVYATTPGAFGTDQQQRAEIFATQASAALTIVVRQAEQTQLTAQLREALASRAVIDQAIGILMAREHTGRDGAFASRRNTSQRQNRKLRDVAHEIIQTVTGQPPSPTPFNDPS